MDQSTRRYTFLRDTVLNTNSTPFIISPYEDAIAKAEQELYPDQPPDLFVNEPDAFDAVIDRAIEIFEAARAVA